MNLLGPDEQPVREEFDVMCELLSFDGAEVLELGCGAAVRTEAIATKTPVARIVAAEVDTVQHEKNLQKTIERVAFAHFGAEKIGAGDEAFDIVIMLKSLHHVPGTQLEEAFHEMYRVLKPGGLAYISEPVFAGDFNEVVRLFHDEEAVRAAAFRAIKRAIAHRQFELVQEYFYLSSVVMQSFEEFRTQVIQVTHTQHRLTAEHLQNIEKRFESFRNVDREPPFQFLTPQRVDLLRKVR